MMKSDSFWERLFYSQKPFRPGDIWGWGTSSATLGSAAW